jgi:hypothetical protein
MFPYAKAPTPPKHITEQIKPYKEYFDGKFDEIEVHTALPFDITEDGLRFDQHEDNFTIVPGKYLTATLANGKRVVALGTALGVVAMYEVDYDIPVPKEHWVKEGTEKFTVTNYTLHAPEIFWTTGLLKLTLHGKTDLSTFIDLFGYPKREGRDDHNVHNIANRLNTIHAAIVSRGCSK